MNRYPGRYSVIGVLVVVLLLLLLTGLLWPLPSTGREKGRRTSCLSNQRQLAERLELYRVEHHGTFPLALLDLKVPETLLQCRNMHGVYRQGYGYNFFLAGKKFPVTGDPQKVFLTADGGNPNHYIDGHEDIAVRRHANGYIASFADGHATFLQETDTVQFK